MAISAKDVKLLRERTGAGMMDCKRALSETSGDMEAAVDFLRAKGLAKAAKKASRVAAEGSIGVRVKGESAVLLEVNCETDFVAKGDEFQHLVEGVLDTVFEHQPSSMENLKALTEKVTTEFTVKCGEKIDVRRYEFLKLVGDGIIGAYNHGGKIGVLVKMRTGKNVDNDPVIEGLVKDVAMHVAATDPKFIRADEIDEDFKAREAHIYTIQLKEEGKPEKMIPQIVKGKLGKLAKDICLLEQKFVKNPDISVKNHINEKAKELGTELTVARIFKFVLGEGIEKKENNLADEVAKMTGGSSARA